MRPEGVADAMHMITSGEDLKEEGYKIGVCKEAKELVKNLPYELTTAQKRALNEMAKDMASGKVMNQILVRLPCILSDKSKYQSSFFITSQREDQELELK